MLRKCAIHQTDECAITGHRFQSMKIGIMVMRDGRRSHMFPASTNQWVARRHDLDHADGAGQNQSAAVEEVAAKRIEKMPPPATLHTLQESRKECIACVRPQSGHS